MFEYISKRRKKTFYGLMSCNFFYTMFCKKNKEKTNRWALSQMTLPPFHKYENNTLPSKFIRKIIFNIDKDKVLFSKIKRVSLISPKKKKKLSQFTIFSYRI
jgi:hypothetical protein